MPAPITSENIADLVSTTLRHLGPPRFYQIAQELPRYTFLDDMLKKDKIQFDTGYGIERDAMFAFSKRARHVSMFATSNVAIPDVMSKIKIPWRHTNTNYGFEEREFVMNTGAARTADLIKSRRVETLIGLATVMEETCWDSSATSTEQTVPYGVNSWVVRGTTAGFTGANPSGFTSGIGEVNSDTTPTWRNYYDEYNAVSKDDLLRKMRTCMRNIDFRAPMNGQAADQEHSNQNRLYTNETVINQLELLAEAQNDNLGVDLAPMTDRVNVNRLPVRWVPYLDNVEDDPIYLLNIGYFYPVVLAGWYLREKILRDNPAQHTTVAVQIDLSWNLMCVDRRRQALMTRETSP